MRLSLLEVCSYRNNLVAGGGGEAAVVSVEGGEVPRQQVHQRERLQLRQQKGCEGYKISRSAIPRKTHLKKSENLVVIILVLL